MNFVVAKKENIIKTYKLKTTLLSIMKDIISARMKTKWVSLEEELLSPNTLTTTSIKCSLLTRMAGNFLIKAFLLSLGLSKNRPCNYN